jgi:predicted Zn-dependent peptidase
VKRALVALAAAATPAHADSLGAMSYRLANGLEVILAPDASAGAVALEVRCRTGTRDDPPNKSGLAAVVASLDDAGSTHVKRDAQREALHAVGGYDLAYAEADHTRFATHVPPSALALALYFEADRLAGFPDAISADDVAKSRERVLLDDRHELTIQRALWSGYTRVVRFDRSIGKRDVVDWWRRECAPSNVSLVVAGRFETTKARALVQRYFSWIPARPRPNVPTPPIAPLHDNVEISDDLGQPIAGSRLVIAYRTPMPTAQSTADLEVATQLLDGKKGRLYHRLVTTDQIATDVSATLTPFARGGQLTIDVTVRSADDLPRARWAVFEEVWKLGRLPLDGSELTSAKASQDLQLYRELEHPMFRARLLANWAMSSDSLDAVRARRARVSVTSLQASATAWLEDRAVVLTVVPLP